MTKSAAKVSKEDSRRPPSEPYPVSATPTNALRALVNSRGVHELVARAMRGECGGTSGMAKIGSFATLHNFSYTTRANISHEKAEQIRARIVCTPAINARRAWGSLCADGKLKYSFFVCWLYLGFYLVGVGAVDDPKET